MINSLEQGKKIIKEKIPLITNNPGVYKMISSNGEILYIGKAKNIPNRLKKLCYRLKSSNKNRENAISNSQPRLPQQVTKARLCF